MKTRLYQWLGRSALSLAPPVLALTLLLTALPTRADTSFTNIGWFIARPLPGIMVTNSSGQNLKGNVHLVRFQSDDARVAGRMEAWMDLAYQPDGTALFCGPAYFEVGTWDGTNFTPSGGVWDCNYSGVIQTDGSTHYSMAGYGIGGAIDGLRVSVTATRANQNPATPYLASGTIRPAPVNTSFVLDDFDDNKIDFTGWTASGAGAGLLSLIEANHQLTIGGAYSSPTYNLSDHTAWIWTEPGWYTANNRTVELQANLVSLNSSSSAAGVGLYCGSGEGFGLAKNGNWILLWKKQTGTTMTFLRGARVTTSDTNVVLVFAVTPNGPDVVLTGKVLDQGGSVLGQVSFVDTPASDAVLSQAEATQLTRWRVLHDLVPDSASAPWKHGTAVSLMVYQDTDGTLPAAEATFDNVVLRTYEAPSIGIERTVRLTWPSSGMNCAIEAAPTPNGPWLPVRDCVPPGCQQMTVPQTGPMQFFRAVQAP